MNTRTRNFITNDLLTITEVANLLNIAPTTAMKRAERNRWEYVLKGGVKLYYRGDFTSRLSPDQQD